VLSRALMALTDWVDRRFGWDRLPLPLGILTLIGVRTRLRERNLHGTGLPDADQTLMEMAADPANRGRRSLDGTLNDLGQPLMGAIHTRFGRNVPVPETYREPPEAMLAPNPRAISRELMTRERFLPATTLNVLAAAWIQFEVHDWFSHGKNEEENPWELELGDDDEWPERPMAIPRTRRDPTSDQDPSTPDTYITDDSHWWDGSQIYGSEERFAEAIRTGEDGKLRIGPDGLPPRDLEQLIDLSGVAGNLWVGLALLHLLFTLEHNAICDRLRREYPDWSDDRLYDKARLINAALMAKIHTTEWTPAIIAHRTTRFAMRATWSGVLGEGVRRRIGHVGSGDVLSGIPGSETNHHRVPYSLTEEFVAVYRLHPLIPDEFAFHSATGGELLQEHELPELGALHVRRRLEEIGVENALYSLGIANPGAISLHNYPRFLQHFDRPDGTRLDLAATDILRIRERGVPRYNQFRRLFRLKPAESFEELAGNPEDAELVRRLYDDQIERVDLMVGLYAERKPEGFGFSDTAFRVFILMASRRLKSDRFFTRDFTAEMYSQAGMDWISESTMATVLLRHFPNLAPALRGVQNAFAPWARVG
jgi:Animal haem peroxidase